MFLIDTSHRAHLGSHGFYTSHALHNSLNLVHNTVSQLTIGPHHNLVSLATFDRSVHNQWDLEDHHTKAGLLKAIASVHDNAQFAAHGDIEDALSFLIRHVMDDNNGDRKRYPDDVIIITDSSSTFHNPLLKSQLQRKSRDVIVISVGTSSSGSHSSSHLATGHSHTIHVSSYAALPSIGGRLFHLLCT